MQREKPIQTPIQEERSRLASEFWQFYWPRQPGQIVLLSRLMPHFELDTLRRTHDAEVPFLALSLRDERSIQSQFYEPLDILDMVFEFARVKDAATALDFANKYGLLGYLCRPDLRDVELFSTDELPVCEPLTVTPGFRLTETGDWLTDAAAIAEALELSSTILARDLARLRRVIHWEDRLVWTDYPAFSAQREGRRGSVISWKDGYGCHPKMGKSRYELWKSEGDVLGPASLYLAAQLTQKLEHNISLRFDLDLNRNLETHARPVNLITAMWLEIANIVTGVKRIGRCAGCGEWMDVTENRRNKRFHQRCALRGQMHRYRNRKKAAEEEAARKDRRKGKKAKRG